MSSARLAANMKLHWGPDFKNVFFSVPCFTSEFHAAILSLAAALQWLWIHRRYYLCLRLDSCVWPLLEYSTAYTSYIITSPYLFLSVYISFRHQGVFTFFKKYKLTPLSWCVFCFFLISLHCSVKWASSAGVTLLVWHTIGHLNCVEPMSFSDWEEAFAYRVSILRNLQSRL